MVFSVTNLVSKGHPQVVSYCSNLTASLRTEVKYFLKYLNPEHFGSNNLSNDYRITLQLSSLL